jgi:hypothetical protein
VVDGDPAKAEHRARRMAGVVASRPRAVASLAAGSISRATIKASASNRVRGGPRRHHVGGLDVRVKPEAAGDAERGGDAAVWQRPDDLKFLPGRQQLFVAQDRADGNLLRFPFGQIGEGAVFDLAGFAVGLAQQNGKQRAAVRDHRDGYEALLTASAGCIKRFRARLHDS